MHIPNPDLRGLTLVLFSTSGNIDRKALRQPHRSPEALLGLGPTTSGRGCRPIQGLPTSDDGRLMLARVEAASKERGSELPPLATQSSSVE
ncbi:hypothetical protein GW17_00035214, partial [Ensete ventricosum]